jgi:hypothetical protein
MNQELKDAVEKVLQEAKSKIEALGVHCLVDPVSILQGMTISLHTGETLKEVAAVYTALEIGAEMAHTQDGGVQFSKRLAFAIEEIFNPETQLSKSC